MACTHCASPKPFNFPGIITSLNTRSTAESAFSMISLHRRRYPLPHLETLVLEEIGETGRGSGLVFHDQDGGRLLIVVGAHKDGTSGRK